ncbi:MAG: phosphoribosylglycinamide formyltransferase [Deltaproteobacteria bacterium]|nr:phosphoribosylglycinamide formyltransferase [Deltaproteobacteria bacterium]
MVNIGVLVSGSGSNLQAIIDSVEAGSLKASIKVVISDNSQAYAIERAKKHGIPSVVLLKKGYSSREEFDKEVVRELKENGVELVVMAGFMRIISKVILEAFPMRIMNIHPSLLPAFPGLDVQKKALEHGVKFSGCTVHFVDEGLDSGPIVIQAAVPVLDADTPETLAKRILAEEHRIYPQAIQFFSEGRIEFSGRRVSIKKNAEPSATVENPLVTVFGTLNENSPP